MANRLLQQFSYTIEKQVVSIYAKVSFGASGAPTLVSGANKGIKSISRSSAGLYVITLGSTKPLVTDTYNKFLMAKHCFIEADDPAAPLMHVPAEAVATAGTVNVQFLGPDGTTATDPANGEIVMLEIVVGNSSAL